MSPKTETIIYVPLDELLWDSEQIPESALGKWWKIYLTLEGGHTPKTLVYGTPNPFEFEVAQEITFSDKVNAFLLEITIGLTVLGIIIGIIITRIMLVKRKQQGKKSG